jgi:hypothetical protein
MLNHHKHPLLLLFAESKRTKEEYQRGVEKVAKEQLSLLYAMQKKFLRETGNAVERERRRENGRQN